MRKRTEKEETRMMGQDTKEWKNLNDRIQEADLRNDSGEANKPKTLKRRIQKMCGLRRKEPNLPNQSNPDLDDDGDDSSSARSSVSSVTDIDSSVNGNAAALRVRVSVSQPKSWIDQAIPTKMARVTLLMSR